MGELRTREQIVAAIAARGRPEPFEVPEWGGDVYLRRLGTGELRAIGYFDGLEGTELSRRLLAACLSDAEGAPLFTQEELAEVEGIDLAVTLRVFKRAASINGLAPEEAEQAAATFDEVQPGDSSTS